MKCSLLRYFLKCSLLASRANLTTARARKYQRTPRMLPNDRKDHSIPLCTREFSRHFFALFVYVVPFQNLLLFSICFQNFLFSLSWKWSKTLFTYYDHLVIQSWGLVYTSDGSDGSGVGIGRKFWSSVNRHNGSGIISLAFSVSLAFIC